MSATSMTQERTRYITPRGAAADPLLAVLREARRGGHVWTATLDRLASGSVASSAAEAALSAQLDRLQRFLEEQSSGPCCRKMLAQFRYPPVVDAVLLHGVMDIDTIRWLLNRTPAWGPRLACNPRLGQGEVDHAAYIGYDFLLRGSSHPELAAYGAEMLVVLQHSGYELPRRLLDDMALRAQAGGLHRLDGILNALVRLPRISESVLRTLYRRHRSNRDLALQVACSESISPELFREVALDHPALELVDHSRMSPGLLRQLAAKHQRNTAFLQALCRKKNAREDPEILQILEASRSVEVLSELCLHASLDEFPHRFQQLLSRNVNAALDLLERVPSNARPLDLLPLLSSDRPRVRQRAFLALAALSVAEHPSCNGSLGS